FGVLNDALNEMQTLDQVFGTSQRPSFEPDGAVVSSLDRSAQEGFEIDSSQTGERSFARLIHGAWIVVRAVYVSGALEPTGARAGEVLAIAGYVVTVEHDRDGGTPEVVGDGDGGGDRGHLGAGLGGECLDHHGDAALGSGVAQAPEVLDEIRTGLIRGLFAGG